MSSITDERSDPTTEKLSTSTRKRRPDANKLSTSITSEHSNGPSIKTFNTSTTTKKQDPTTYSETTRTIASSPTLDPTAATLVQPAKFATGDSVLYNSSQGEHLRAVVVRLHRDKKNRPYYVVRLPKGKEKQVYGHRLRPYVRQEYDTLRRSRSRSRGVEEGRDRGRSSARSSSKVSKSSRHDKPIANNPDLRRSTNTNNGQDILRRSESIDSRRSTMSNSSRRSRTSRERNAVTLAAAAADRDEFLASTRDGRQRHRGGEDSSTAHRRRHTRDESSTPSVRERHASDPTPVRRTRSPSKERSSRGRSQSTVRRSKSTVSSSGHHATANETPSSSRLHPHGRERSRSRAPSEESSLRSSHHHQSAPAMTSSRGRSSRPSTPGVSMSSKTSSPGGGGDHHSHYSSAGDHGGEEQQQQRTKSKGRSISKLRSFRQSFTSMKKK